MADRIEEIKYHLAAAEGPDRQSSHHMWVAAQLIWEEIEEGKSRRQLAQEIGKSHTHVRYMYNCWDLVGRKVMTGEADTEALPNFNEVYHSTEVRGDPDEQGRGEGKRRERELDDHSAHGLAMKAASVINELASNPAFWPLMTEEDWMVIRELPAVIRSMLRESGHR